MIAALCSRCLKINRVIKLAASAAFPMTKLQESPQCHVVPCRAVVHGLLCILVIGEAALAADLIARLIFENLEQNLQPEWLRKLVSG